MPASLPAPRMAHASADSLHLRLDRTTTLMAALHAAVRASTGGLVYVRETGDEVRQSYAELLEVARRIAVGLRAQKLGPGDPVLLQLERPEDFIPGFWGCIAAGAIPVPVAVGPTFTQPNSALQKLLNAATLFGQVPVLASGTALRGLRQLPASIGRLPGSLLDLDELRAAASVEPSTLPEAIATDVAVLLLTSGSTGRPKGVPLTHGNLIAMAAGTSQANAFSAREVTLNWMALDHVGSISFLGTMAVFLGCTQIHVPTGYILQDPLRWLDLISRHRATMSWAPNFAFTLFLDRTAAVEQGQWDLSCMRFLVNAGESVVARTARRFITLLQRHGLPPDALRPAFGMSESCSGLTWSRGFTLENSSDDQPFVNLGPCIPGAELRIVDEQDRVLPEGQPGLFQIRGPSVFSGYYRNAALNAEVIRDGWYTTGDLAYLQDGCLFITGRQKDVIIVNGANFYCHEIEAVAEAVPGVAKTFTAAVGVRDANADTDQLALFFCPQTEERGAIEAMVRVLRAKLIQEAGVAAAYFVRMNPAEMPKTEIGKIQRTQLRKAFEAGTYRDRIVQLSRAPRAAVAIEGRPQTRGALTAAITRIWQEVLGVESVGLDETFFELGGHSLLVVQVQMRLQELMGRAVAIVELFDCPTVRTMAEHFSPELQRGHEAGQAEPRGAHATTAPALESASSRDIAIIGLALRFPGASTAEEFWQILAEGRETIRTFTVEDALAAGVDPALVRNPNYVRAAPMLDAPEAFDAEFFRYTAKEARLIDPQQRVFLEVCWEALEDAGYDPLSYPGKVGLFASAGLNTYLANNLLANREFLREENGGRMLTVDSMSGFNIMITNDKDYLPTRVSYKLNLRGPSVNVQTACSSTLVTLHQACNSLLLGDCDMALAGGVSIKLPQHAGHLYSAGMLNSPDGHCRAYDEKAEGTIFGNGAGVVLLKPLAAAQRDGDHLYAVIKATATNNDGAGKVGFTAPSASGQEDVCAEALRRAGVSPDSITFLEGHGTGTPLGDPIEVNALAAAFRRQTARTGFCALGSVKSNLGHLQIASGIAGLIKTTLALHHRQIPGTLHFERPNPRIEFAQTPFFVNRDLRPWESSGGPRRAGVNSLGIGGSNVHVILEEAALRVPSAASGGPWLLPLSARHPEALRQLAGRYAEFLAKSADTSLDDLAFTAQVGRAPLPNRAAFVGESRSDLVTQLRTFAAAPVSGGPRIEFEQKGLVFSFGHEGNPNVAIVRRLHDQEPVFRSAVEHCAAILTRELGFASAEVLPDTAIGGRAAVRFAWEYALVDLLASYGIEPVALIASGQGDYLAACRAGILSLEDALRLLAAETGAPGQFRTVAQRLTFGRSTQKIVSAETGLDLEVEMGSADYWIARKQPGSPATVAQPFAPNSTFGALVEIELASRAAHRGVDGSIPRLAAANVPALIGALFTLGYSIDWSRGRRSRPGHRVSLPTYPWQHTAYLIEGTDLRPGTVRPEPATVTSESELLGRCWRSPGVREIVYETHLSLPEFPWLAEHRVHGRVVAPGAMFLTQVARQAADLSRRLRDELEHSRTSLSDVVFVRPLVVDPALPSVLQTIFVPVDGGGPGAYRFQVVSFADDDPANVIVHATGRVDRSQESPPPRKEEFTVPSLVSAVPPAVHFRLMDSMGIALGGRFRRIQEIRVGPGESWVRLGPPSAADGERGWHPGLVDSFLQAAVSACQLDGTRTFVPFGVRRFLVQGPPNQTFLWAHARRIAGEGRSVGCDVRVYDAAGAVLVEVLGFELRELPAPEPDAPVASGAEPEYIELGWERLPLPATAGTPNGPWLLLADDGPASAVVERLLSSGGASVTRVGRRESAQAEVLLRTRDWDGVVCAWNLETCDPAQIAWRELLGCVQGAASRDSATPARWVLVTNANEGALAQSPLGGFLLGVASEFPKWRPLHVELEVGGADLSPILPWLWDRRTTETHLALRDGVVHGARLTRTVRLGGGVPITGESSYVITGGAGALGLATAGWLVEKGARRIVLSGRSPATPELVARCAAWKSAGATVRYQPGDVASAHDVAALVAAAEALGPLRGVFHAAGQLSDRPLRTADPDAFATVFAAKITGAWQLHLAVQGRKLDHFVLFSSIASLLGSPAQANYAAGNAFLDALARQRRQDGLPALSLQWGPWAEIGMTARLSPHDRDRVRARGFVPLAPSAALQALERVLGAASPCVAVLAWDRTRLRASLGAEVPALYSRLLSAADEMAVAGVSAAPPAEAARPFASLPLPERTEAIEYLIRETVATILGFASPQQVERERSLFDLGVDSLSAVDVKNRLETALGTTLRATIAFDYPSAAAMAEHLATTLFPAPAAKPAARAQTDLTNLTTDELKSLLEDELTR